MSIGFFFPQQEHSSILQPNLLRIENALKTRKEKKEQIVKEPHSSESSKQICFEVDAFNHISWSCMLH